MIDHDKNVALQAHNSHSGYGRDIREGSLSRAHEAVHELRGLWPADGELGNVLVIGPHDECELAAFSFTGAKVMGLDIVPEFAERIRAEGFACAVGAAEQLPGALPVRIPPRWNVYSSHALEHCYDRAAAFAGIRSVADKWVWLVVPIELRETRNEAHLSQFWSLREVWMEFVPHGWEMRIQMFKLGEDGFTGEARFLFVRKTN